MKRLTTMGIILLFIMMIISSSTGSIVVEDTPHAKLYIDGPTNGKAGESYTYSIIIIDPDENDYALYIDWDDGTDTDWFGPVESNVYYNSSHTWNECGTYNIRAIAKDQYDSELYASLGVTMPKNNPNNNNHHSQIKMVVYGLFPQIDSLNITYFGIPQIQWLIIPKEKFEGYIGVFLIFGYWDPSPLI